jgi:hypothetical protein
MTQIRYDQDIVAWAREQAVLLRSGQLSAIDAERSKSTRPLFFLDSTKAKRIVSARRIPPHSYQQSPNPAFKPRLSSQIDVPAGCPHLIMESPDTKIGTMLYFRDVPAFVVAPLSPVSAPVAAITKFFVLIVDTNVGIPLAPCTMHLVMSFPCSLMHTDILVLNDANSATVPAARVRDV